MERIIFFIRNNPLIIILTQRSFLFSTLNYDKFAQRVKYLPVLGLLEKNSEVTLFFDYGNTALFFIIPLIFLFSVITINLIKKTLIYSLSVMYFIVPLLGISFIFYLSPTVMLFFSLIASGFLLNLTYSEFFSTWISSKLHSRNLILYLEEIGLLHFFFRLFSFVFTISNSLQFVFILSCSHLLSFFYTIFSRYLVFFTFVIPLVFPPFTKLLLYCVIFICLTSVLIRFLINSSIIIVNVVLVNNPIIWENFLLTEPFFDPDKNPPRSDSNNGWFSRYNYNYNYHHGSGGIPPRLNVWKAAGFGIGVCTLGVGCFVAYHTYGAHIEAQKQTLEAQQANRLKRYELAKQNPKDIDFIYNGYPEERDQLRRK